MGMEGLRPQQAWACMPGRCEDKLVSVCACVCACAQAHVQTCVHACVRTACVCSCIGTSSVKLGRSLWLANAPPPAAWQLPASPRGVLDIPLIVAFG